ncbi:hypothetical protein HK099_002300 [Clydaea vesicula]|uniref:Uncharacterized protein n=1 Tax=Clydaea vesicula TaxID=447962 RepID=A0AAD5U324_9FUNG|nr:hypothetical protein HK099_002300 [Clydaea vesicula]
MTNDGFSIEGFGENSVESELNRSRTLTRNQSFKRPNKPSKSPLKNVNISDSIIKDELIDNLQQELQTCRTNEKKHQTKINALSNSLSELNKEYEMKVLEVFNFQTLVNEINLKNSKLCKALESNIVELNQKVVTLQNEGEVLQKANEKLAAQLKLVEQEKNQNKEGHAQQLVIENLKNQLEEANKNIKLLEKNHLNFKNFIKVEETTPDNSTNATSQRDSVYLENIQLQQLLDELTMKELSLSEENYQLKEENQILHLEKSLKKSRSKIFFSDERSINKSYDSFDDVDYELRDELNEKNVSENKNKDIGIVVPPRSSSAIGKFKKQP